MLTDSVLPVVTSCISSNLYSIRSTSFEDAAVMDKKLIEEIRGMDNYGTISDRFSRKLRENPFLGVGIMGLVGACTVGGLRFNKRAVGVPASFYLMQLRVAAQSCVVGSLAVGLAYSTYQHGSWPIAEAQAKSENRKN